MSKYYIAYGSNLSVSQMKYRTPDARIVGTAVLDGWGLTFKEFATIEQKENHTTPVLVWEISEGDEKNLDRYEGFPNLYYKKDLEVTVTPLDDSDPITLTAMVYIMDEKYDYDMPSLYYYAILVNGYERFGFDRTKLADSLEESLGKDCAEAYEEAYTKAYGFSIKRLRSGADEAISEESI